jgi:hypothetical protein
MRIVTKLIDSSSHAVLLVTPRPRHLFLSLGRTGVELCLLRHMAMVGMLYRIPLTKSHRPVFFIRV